MVRPDLLLKNPQRLLERQQGLCAILQRKQRAVADRVVLDEELTFGHTDLVVGDVVCLKADRALQGFVLAHPLKAVGLDGDVAQHLLDIGRAGGVGDGGEVLHAGLPLEGNPDRGRVDELVQPAGVLGSAVQRLLHHLPELVVCQLHGHLRGVDRVAFQREQRGVALLLQPQPPIAAGEGEVGRGAGCLLQLIQREGGAGESLQRLVDGRAGLFAQVVGGGVGVGHFVDKPDRGGIFQH